MNEMIKQRIEQIKAGQVPEGYKRTKIGIVPDEWEEMRFKNMFSRVTRKNKENNDNVLTISAQYGLINQRDFFNKDIASDDKSNYYLLENGEFAYNKSYSNGYPYGALKRLDMYDKGIVSPLYICFAANEENKCPDFYVHYFEAGKMNREIQAFAQEGARNHGLLNISVDDFFNSNIVAPSLPEQEKITEILSAQDKLIALKEKLIEEKKKQKKSLMQQLITGKKRLPEASEEWDNIKLSELCSVICDGDWIESNDQSESGIRLIQTGNIGVGEYLNKNERARYINEETFDRLHCTEIFEGDVLVSRLPDPIGRACRVPRLLTKAITAVDCSILRFKDKRFADYFLQYATTQDYFSKIAILAGGSTRTRISRKEIEKLIIPVPIDMENINSICYILSLADNEILLHKKELNMMKQNKKALMQLLLTGIVRVK